MLINFYTKRFIGVVDDLSGIIARLAPTMLAPTVEQGGKVVHLVIVFYHVGIQTRYEQDIVNQVQQHICVLLDFVGKYRLVFQAMLCFEQVGKTNHCV